MQSILLFTRFDKKNLYEKMPPQNETALVLFKLGLQNIRKLFHIANGIVLFPERAVVSQYRLFSPHKRDSDYGCPCGCWFSCSFDRHKTLAPDNHEPRFLEIFRIEKFADLLITTDLPLIEAATRSGFTDYKNISRIFTKAKEMTPLQYRKRFTPKNK